MTARDPEALATRRRPLDGGEMARISPLPPPEEVFIDWLLSVPHGADLAAAARRQIEIIDARALLHPDVRCLRMLLVALAEQGHWRPPVLNL